MSSRHLSSRQLRAIDRIGDAMIPGDRDFPSFSASRCSLQVDRILDFMPEQDLKDLGTLLSILSFLPGFLLAMLMRFLELAPSIPTPVGALLRLIRLGLRGLIMSLYYSSPQALGAMEYKVGVYTADIKGS